MPRPLFVVCCRCSGEKTMAETVTTGPVNEGRFCKCNATFSHSPVVQAEIFESGAITVKVVRHCFQTINFGTRMCLKHLTVQLHCDRGDTAVTFLSTPPPPLLFFLSSVITLSHSGISTKGENE